MAIVLKRTIKNDIYPVVVTVYVYDSISDVVCEAGKCNMPNIEAIQALSTRQSPYFFNMHYSIDSNMVLVHHEIGHTVRDIFRYLDIPLISEIEEPLQYYSDYLFVKTVNILAHAQEKQKERGEPSKPVQ